MKGKRLWDTFRLALLRTPDARAEYCRKHHVFAAIGKNCRIMNRKVPLYANLIRFGDNVTVATNVGFNTHDGISCVLNNLHKAQPTRYPYVFQEEMGCIDIGSNVFIGAGSLINYNIRIGDNVIITAGSVITNDIPSNSVVRGCPAKVICSFDAFYQMRAVKEKRPEELRKGGDYLNPELQAWMWEKFERDRS